MMRAVAAEVDLAVIELLLKSGADLEVTDVAGRTALHFAAEEWNLELTEPLLKRGANTYARDLEGLGAINWFWPSKTGRPAMIKLFHKYGWEIPLHDYIRSGDPSLIEAKIGKDPDVVHRADNHGRTPLHLAAIWERADTSQVILAAGSDINARDAMGRTPLHLAAMHAKPKMIPVLLAGGAEMEARDNNGQTALDLAKKQGAAEVVRSLRKHEEGN